MQLLPSKDFQKWQSELDAFIQNNSALFIAIFNNQKELKFVNSAFSDLLKDENLDRLINPKFEDIINLDTSKSPIYKGFLTIGDHKSVNTSIQVKIFRKSNEFLVIGEVEVKQLLEHNHTMHSLNRNINDLQYELIKKKKDQERILRQLNIANEELTELNTTKDKLFAIIAHDLKNPFNVIIGFSELLKNGEAEDEETLSMIYDNIYKSSKAAYSLLENLLAWSKLQRGELQPELILINTKELFQEIYDLCQPMAQSKEIRFELFKDSIPDLKADQNMIKMVLINLITNAIKYTHANGLISVSYLKTDQNYIFKVSDTGIGIEKKYLDRLFYIDCKLSMKGTANETGTGLGLMLSKEFINKHHGEIWVESELNKGSHFYFTIPFSN